MWEWRSGCDHCSTMSYRKATNSKYSKSTLTKTWSRKFQWFKASVVNGLLRVWFWCFVSGLTRQAQRRLKATNLVFKRRKISNSTRSLTPSLVKRKSLTSSRSEAWSAKWSKVSMPQCSLMARQALVRPILWRAISMRKERVMSEPAKCRQIAWSTA